MSAIRRRRYVLTGLLAVVGLLTIGILWEVVQVVFFAITVAYVLYPVRIRLVNRGLSTRIASALTTTAAFVGLVLMLLPIVWTLVRRRRDFVELFRGFPDDLPIEAMGFEYVVDVASLVDTASVFLRDVAISVATDAFVLLLQLLLFTFLLYGLLLRPHAVKEAAFEVVPPEYHDIIRALDARVSGTLYALYVVQAATAIVTFPLGVIVFYALGYDSVFVLSVVAAILQFIPVVGPGMLAAALAGHDLLLGLQNRAIAVIILGPLVVGLLPDVAIRPRLASSQANLPASLYFVGFVGGVLTVGVIGIIAGPLVVALLVEVVDLLADSERIEGYE